MAANRPKISAPVWRRRLRAVLPRFVVRSILWLRRRWLSAVAANAFVRNLLLPLLPAAVFRIAFSFFQREPLSLISDKLANELLFDTFMVFLGWLLVQFSRTWGVREMMASVYAIASATQDPKRTFFRNYAADEIRGVRVVVEQLAQGTYRAENPEVLARWFDALFADGGYWYTGIDSHLPSDYMWDYSWYLETHARALAVRGPREDGRRDARILTTSRDALTQDYARATGLYGAFYDWHHKHEVDARWLPSVTTDLLRKKYGLGIADVGIWANYAVLFSPDQARESEAVTFSIHFKGEQGAGGGPSYEDILRFADEVRHKSRDLGEVAPRLELVDQQLADQWEAYVDPPSRENGPLGRFLLQVLKGRQYVLDAAAGIGSDSVFLLQHDYTVWSNEVDLRLAEAAQTYAARMRQPLRLLSYLWETLPDSLEQEGKMRFDAVLVLGNSICLVPQEEQRKTCLKAFHDVLRPGGVLIIDERNFSYLLGYRSEIMSDPAKWFEPTLKGDMMYGGRRVRGFPADITEHSVAWRFFSNNPPVKGDRASIVENLLKVRDLRLYPFRHGELFELLGATGFVNVAVYVDFEHFTTDCMPSSEAIGDAVFLTYVAVRPDDTQFAPEERAVSAHPQGPGA